MSERRGPRVARHARSILLMAALLVLVWEAAIAVEVGGRLGLGRAADPTLVAAQDIAIGPEGDELPPGRGGVAQGAALYVRHCAMCHGPQGNEGPDPALVGGQGSLASPTPQMTIGSYWPYATTVYDYIYRAMPFTHPGSLPPDAVYALTAFLLHANGIVAADTVLDRDSLPAVVMPNRHGFVPDPRPDLPLDDSAARR